MSTRASWVSHFGLTRTPFSKSIAASDLFARTAHVEAVVVNDPKSEQVLP